MKNRINGDIFGQPCPLRWHPTKKDNFYKRLANFGP